MEKAAEEQFGFSKDFMFGQKPTLAYAPKRDQSLADNVFQARMRARTMVERVKLLSKDGKECYQTRTVAPLYDRAERSSEVSARECRADAARRSARDFLTGRLRSSPPLPQASGGKERPSICECLFR